MQEKSALEKTFKKNDIIVATGGGTPCFFDNMDQMNDKGITVYLQASSGLLFHRLATSKTERPLLKDLKDVDLALQIKDQLAFRERWYERAKYAIETTNLKASDIIKLLAKEFRKEAKP